MTKIRAVTIDLDNTIWHCWPLLNQAIATTQTYHEEHYPSLAAAYPMSSTFKEVLIEVAEEDSSIAHDYTGS